MAAAKTRQKKKNPDLVGSEPRLRDRAENLLEHSPGGSSEEPAQNAESLIHELRVHQIELEMQAEELRRAQGALEESLDKYLDLYDFAPVGYLTLSDKALILEVNLTASALLGAEKRRLINRGLGRYIAPGDRDRWDQYFAHVRQNGEKQSCILMLVRSDGSRFPARLESIRLSGSNEGAGTIRVAVSNISDIWQIEALKESEEQLALAIDGSGVGIWDWHIPANKLVINQRSAEISGYTLAELSPVSTETWTGLCHPDDIRQSNAQLQAHLAKESPHYACEVRMHHKNGHWVWVLNRGTVVEWDPDGLPVRMTGTYLDITERKEAEETIRQNAVFTRDLVENLPGYIVVYGARGKILYVNLAAARALGYDAETLAGTSVLSYIAPEYHEQATATMKARMRGEVPPPYEIDIISQDGSRRSVIAKGIPIQYRDTPAILLLLVDITDSKRAEGELRLAQFRLESAMAVGFIAWWEMDVITGNVCFNERKALMLGYLPEQFSHYSDFTLLIHPDDYLPVMQAMRDHLSGTTGQYEADYRIRTCTGEYLWFHDIGRISEYTPEGKPRKITGLVIDITGRKKAEETIQHALMEKEVLLREIHHRVKNNLTVIISLINLQTSTLTDPVAISQLRDLESRIQSMALVHASLYLTTDLGRINFAVYTENLTRHLFRVYRKHEEVRCMIDMGGVTMPLETAIPCGLVMSEIITNSLKYAFPDTGSCEEIRGEPCTISLSLRYDGNSYHLRIADNGIGMPEGTQERIGASRTRSLGVYLIRHIVEHQMGGTIGLSTAGGTAYTLSFPEPIVLNNG